MCDNDLSLLSDPYGHSGSDGKFSRRTALDMMLAGGLGALTGFPSLAASKDEVVRIGYLPITDATPLLVAHALGYFADEGLESAPPTLIRSWPGLVEGFASHKFNVVHLLKPIPIWMRYNNKFPVKVVGWCHTNGSALVVGGNSGIDSFAECGGKQLAVPFWYSVHNVILQLALREAGLTPVIKPLGESLASTEVNLQILPPPEMPAGLAARKIDGYIVAEPFNALGEIKAGGKVLRFTGDIWKNHPCCVMSMHEGDLDERPEWTQKVVNAVVRASGYAAANKAEVARLLSRDGSNLLPLPAEVIMRAMTHYDVPEYRDSGAVQHVDQWRNGRIDFAPYPYPSATKMLVAAMRETIGGSDAQFLDGLDPEFVASDLVDDRFVLRSIVKNPELLALQNAGGPDFTREEVLQL